MPSYAREKIVKSNEVSTYHLVNRCVRRAFLLGDDKVSGRNFDHRKQWLIKRMTHVIKNVFCIDMIAYTIMSNHVHFVITIRPDLASKLSDEEIVQRWWKLYPRKIRGEYPSEPPPLLKALFLSDRTWLETRRKRLSSVSDFMASIAEYIARKANKEDDVTGRFWEGRFKSQLLLDEHAVLAAATYVDLNPIRAKIANSLEECDFTSIQQRIAHLKFEDNVTTTDQFSKEFSRNYCKINLMTPSLARNASDYVGICIWKAAEATGKTPEIIENIFKIAIEPLNSVMPYLDLNIVRSSKFAVGSKEMVDEFAKRRGVSRAYNASISPVYQT